MLKKILRLTGTAISGIHSKSQEAQLSVCFCFVVYCRAAFTSLCLRFMETHHTWRFDSALEESQRRCVGVLQEKIDLQKGEQDFFFSCINPTSQYVSAELLEIQQLTGEHNQANAEKASLEARVLTALKMRNGTWQKTKTK